MRARQASILSIALALGLASGWQPAPAAAVVPLKKVYNPTPEYESGILGIKGYFSSGIALVDLNRDGHEDMVVANGIDMSPQNLAVYYSGRPSNEPIFNPWPDWVSQESGYMNGLSVGDVNGDGWPDVAVAFAFDTSRDISTGSVKVFFNHDGRLEPQPRFQTSPDGFLPLACALADLDADGDLDLAVAAVLEGEGIWGGNEPISFELGRARVYLNEGGTFSAKPVWTAAQRLGAGSVVAADINQDGWMDLALGAPRTAVYYGGPPTEPGKIPLPLEASWLSVETFLRPSPPFYSLDAGFPGKAQGTTSTVPATSGEGLMLAVSPGCGTNLDSPCASPILLYLPQRGTRPVWRSEEAHFASGNLLGDYNGDGYLDLATGQFGVQLPGGPIWLFQGPFASSRRKPALALDGRRVWQKFAAGNLQCPSLNPRVQHTFTVTGAADVLTLPERILAGVEAVARDGRPLSPADWIWSPGTNWVSLRNPASAGESLSVTYRVPLMLDLAVTSWNPDRGNVLFLSFLKPCQ